MRGFKNLLLTNTSIRQSVFKNTAWLYFAQFASRAIKFSLIVVAARELKVADYGAFNYATYLLGFFFIFSDIGLSIFQVRELQKKDVNHVALTGTIFFLKLVITSLVTILALVVTPFLHSQTLRIIYTALIVVYLIGALRAYLVSFAFARQHMQYDSWSSVIDALFTTVFGCLILTFTHSVIYLPFAYVMGSIISFVFLVYWIRPFIISGPHKPSFAESKRVLVASFPFLFTSALVTILSQTDVFFIERYLGLEQVGHYTAGLKLVQILLALPGPFIISLFPVFSGLINDSKRIASILNRSLSVALLLGIPIGTGGFVLAHKLIPQLFGIQYSQGISSFQILILLVPILYLIMVLDDALVSLNYQLQNMIFTSFAAGVNILLNFILVPQFGITGAAFATLASQILNLLVTYRLTASILHTRLVKIKQIFIYSFATIVMTFTVLLLDKLSSPLALSIILGALSYCVILYVVREREFMYILHLLPFYSHRVQNHQHQ